MLKNNKDKKYLAAVSGGPDSMAMLDQYKDQIAIVCHVNYNKRNSSIRDKQIVLDYCKKNNLECECLDIDKKIYELNSHRNFQTLARELRYSFFENIGKKYQIFNLLVAHNLDDFLETAYMQQTRHSKSLFYGIVEINTINNLTI